MIGLKAIIAALSRWLKKEEPQERENTLTWREKIIQERRGRT